VSERLHVHLVIAGRVQGVAFRACLADEARGLGVSGWVRNLPDGRVEAEAEGPKAGVEALVAWCRHGPPSAAVESVQVDRSPFRGDLQGFQIRR
jgi:acylphosphatase